MTAPLLGREATLAALHRFAAGGGPHRLLLCGPPGIGKSALLAALLCDAPDAWLIDCAQLSSIEQLCVALSARRAWGGQPALRMADLAGSLPPLVLLDHAERLVASASQLDPGTRWLLATQQTDPHERVELVGGLDTAAARALLGATDDALDPLIARCEGSPLALHIVSRRLGLMTPAELLARLGSGVLLTGHAPDTRSMSQIIDLAWERLDPPLRDVWAACSVWSLAFSLDDAELVAPPLPTSLPMCDALDALAAASIIERRVGGWHMAETLRGFAQRRAPDQVEAARERQREGLTAWAEETARRLRDHDDQAARAALLARQLSLLHLLEHPGPAPWQRRLLHALAPLMAEQGMFAAIMHGVDALVGIHVGAHGGADTAALELSLYRALAQGFSGDLIGARARLDALEPLTRADARAAMYHDYTGGLLHLIGREHDAARPLLERALEQGRAQGDTRLICRALSVLANVSTSQRQLDRALTEYDEAIGAAQAAGFESTAMQSRGNRAGALLMMSRVAEAIPALEQIAAFDEAHGQHRNLCVVLGNLGAAYMCVGEQPAAVAALDRALALNQTQREPRSLCLQLIRRAQAALWSGEDATRWLDGAAALIDGLRAVNAIAEHHLTRALHHLRRDQPGRAQSWLIRLSVLGPHDLGDEAAAVRSVLTGWPPPQPQPSLFSPLLHLLWHLYGTSEALTLRVAADGSAFRLGEQPPVALGRSGPGRRLLVYMAARAAADPDAVIDAWALFEAGWPEQVGVPSSGLNRLYTAINRLRAAGLQPALETVPDGYRLRARVRCVAPDAV